MWLGIEQASVCMFNATSSLARQLGPSISRLDFLLTAATVHAMPTEFDQRRKHLLVTLIMYEKNIK